MALYVFTSSDPGVLDTVVAERVEALRAATGRDRAVVVTPQVAQAHAMGRMLADRGVRSIGTSSVNQWLAKEWESHGGASALVDAALRRRLVDEACAAQAAEQAEVAAFLGKGGVREILEGYMRSVGAAPGAEHAALARSTMGETLAAVRERYVALLDREHAVEPADATVQLRDVPAAAAQCIAFHGFTSFTAQQLTLLRALATTTDVVLTLLFADEVPALAAVAPLKDYVTSLATSSGGAVTVIGADDGTSATEDTLSDLRKCWYSEEGAPFATAFDDGRLLPVLTQGRAAEITAAVAQAQRLCARYAPERVAIVARHCGGIADRLGDALLEAGVPYAVDRIVPLVPVSLARAFRDLFRFDARTYPLLEPTGDFVHLSAREAEPFLASAFSGWSREQFLVFDSTMRRSGVRMEAAVAKLAATGGGADTNANVRLFRQALASGAPSDYKKVVDALLAAARTSGLLAERELEAVYAAHHELLAVLSYFAQDPAVEHIEPGALLSEISRRSVALTVAPGTPAVTVTDASRIRGRSLDALVFLGLAADDFAAALSESPAQVAAARLQREMLTGRSEASGAPTDPATALGETVARRRDEEALLFYEALATAAQETVLIADVQNEQGEIRPLSHPLEQCLTALAPQGTSGSEPYTVAWFAQLGARGVPLVAHDTGAVATARLAFGGGRGAVVARGEGLEPPATIAHGTRRLRLYDEARRVTGDAPRPFSPTELDTYAKCPFRWFVTHALSASALDTDFDTTVQGTLAHALLGRFYPAFLETGEPRVTPENLDKALTCFDALVAQIRTASDGAETGVVYAELTPAQQLEYDGVVADVRGRIRADADILMTPGFTYDPVCFEYQLGAKGEYPRVKGVPITGRIDRIDRCRQDGSPFIIDYKRTLNGYRDGKKFAETCAVQAALYALAYADELAHADECAHDAEQSEQFAPPAHLRMRDAKERDALRLASAYLPYGGSGAKVLLPKVESYRVAHTSGGEQGGKQGDGYGVLAYAIDPERAFHKRVRDADLFTPEEFLAAMGEVAAMTRSSALTASEGYVPVASGVSQFGQQLKGEAKGCQYCPFEECPSKEQKKF